MKVWVARNGKEGTFLGRCRSRRMRTLQATVAAALSLMAFAGCTGTDEPGDNGTTPGTTTDAGQEDRFELTVVGVQDRFPVGGTMGLLVHVTGDGPFTTDHIGAHWWTEEQDDPTAALGDSMGCDHVAGTLPGSFEVKCKILRVGDVHLRGHARYDGDGMVNVWGEDHVVSVYPAPDTFALTASNVPTAQAANETFAVALQIDAPENVTATSQHIGAHWWKNRTADPTGDFGNATGACGHTVGNVPGTFSIQCNMTEAGTFYFRGHLRLTVDGEDHDYWTREHAIVVP